MNVCRRFAPDVSHEDARVYERALSIRRCSRINLRGGDEMILFGIGTGRIQLAGASTRHGVSSSTVNAATACA